MSAGHHARDRESTSRRPLVIGLVVMAGVMAALVTREAVSSDEAAACASHPEATIVAAPGLAPALEDAAAAMTDEGRCSRITVKAEESSAVYAQLLAADRDSRDSKDSPTLWVPDSDIWVDQLAAEGIETEVLAAALASSPIVLASGPSTTAPPSWFAALSSGRVAVADPQADSASAMALVAPRAERETSGVSDAEIQARLVPLAQHYGERASAQQPVAERLAAVSLTTKQMFPVSEQVWLEARRANRRVHAVVPQTGTFLQRYPLLGLSAGTDAGNSPAVAEFLDYLSRPQGALVLADHDLRDKTGAALPGGVGIGYVTELARPSAAEIRADLRMWDVLTVPSSLLAVVDASGSMDFKAGANTRMQLAMSAAGTALQAFPDNARVGLWLFSIDLGDGTDHRELVPLRRLDKSVGPSNQRDALRSWLGKALDLTGGGTGLYDTTLAAFRSAQKDYDPDYFNAVVLLSDGANDDPGSIRQADLLKALRDEADPERPVRIIAIGISDDADMKALKKIGEATNGGAYEARDPRDILKVIAKALLAR